MLMVLTMVVIMIILMMLVLMIMIEHLVIFVWTGLECCINSYYVHKRKALQDFRMREEDGTVVILVSLVIPQSCLHSTDRVEGEPANWNDVKVQEVNDNGYDIDDNKDDKPGGEIDVPVGSRGGRQYSVSHFILSSFDIVKLGHLSEELFSFNPTVQRTHYPIYNIFMNLVDWFKH